MSSSVVVSAVMRACRSRRFVEGPLLVSVVEEAWLAGKTLVATQIPREFSEPNRLSRVKAAEFANSILAQIAQSPQSEKVVGPVGVEILVMTALAIEEREVISLLANCIQVVHPYTGTIYTVGSFPSSRSLNVAVVATSEGNAASASETERAVAYFQPRVALFVGVAGGLKADVALGDVVAANWVYDYTQAKEDSQGVHGRVKTLEASYSLLQRASKVAQEENWAAILGDNARSEQRVATVFVKPIAAGSRVLASTDSPSVQWIKDHCSDALAVEMERFGFHMALRGHKTVEALVVRGISDLVDGKSADADADWQPVAARRAAAFGLVVAHEWIHSQA